MSPRRHRPSPLLSFAKDRSFLPSSQRASSHPTKIIYPTTNCTEWAGDSQMRLYIELGLGLKLVREYRPLRRRSRLLTVPYTNTVNLDLYGEPYAPVSVVQGRPRLLLAYQELVSLRLLGIEFY